MKDSKANELYNMMLKAFVYNVPVNSKPYGSTKVWADENGELKTKTVNIYESDKEN